MNFYNRILSFWKTTMILTGILILCLIPSTDLQKFDLLKFNFTDLVVHMIMFFVFSVFLYHDLKVNTLLNKNTKALIASVVTISLMFGILTEMLQYLLPSLNRTASLSDLIFDIAGTSLGILYMRLIRR